MPWALSIDLHCWPPLHAVGVAMKSELPAHAYIHAGLPVAELTRLFPARILRPRQTFRDQEKKNSVLTTSFVDSQQPNHAFDTRSIHSRLQTSSPRISFRCAPDPSHPIFPHHHAVTDISVPFTLIIVQRDPGRVALHKNPLLHPQRLPPHERDAVASVIILPIRPQAGDPPDLPALLSAEELIKGASANLFIIPRPRRSPFFLPTADAVHTVQQSDHRSTHMPSVVTPLLSANDGGAFCRSSQVFNCRSAARCDRSPGKPRS